MRAKPLLNLAGDRLYALPLIVLYLTDGCNSRCVSCDIWRNPRRNMSLSLVEQIVSEVGSLGIRWVLLSGGEAMQHPQWAVVARMFREAGVFVMLLTNGLLLRKQVQAVADNVNEVIVSLDAGCATTYQAIRGVDAFELVLEGMRAARAAGVTVVTRTTIQRANYTEIPEIVAVAQRNGAHRVSFLPVDTHSVDAFGARFSPDPELSLSQTPQALALDRDDIQRLRTLLERFAPQLDAWYREGLLAESPAKMWRLADYFEASRGDSRYKPSRCNAPHISVVVEVDGRLRPCYFLPTFGVLAGQTVNDALNVPLAVALRQAYRSGQRPECARCVCPLYKGPRALLRM